MDDRLADEAYGRALTLASDALGRARSQADLRGLALFARAALSIEAYREEPSVADAAARFVADELPDGVDDPAALGFALWCQALSHARADADLADERFWDIAAEFADTASEPEWRTFKAPLDHTER